MLFGVGNKSAAAVTTGKTPPGRAAAMPVAGRHLVLGNPMQGPFADGLECAAFALGCFWGAERIYWQLPGIYTTAVGYAGGDTPNPTYAEVCGGGTGHAEAVLVVFDPKQIGYAELLRAFWESHDPTQGMRQGNDVGSQYRSVIYPATAEQSALAAKSKIAYQRRLTEANHGAITTEITPLAATTDTPPTARFYYAEDPHQQYLAKNPGGYCGLGGTGVRCG